MGTAGVGVGEVTVGGGAAVGSVEEVAAPAVEAVVTVGVAVAPAVAEVAATVAAEDVATATVGARLVAAQVVAPVGRRTLTRLPALPRHTCHLLSNLVPLGWTVSLSTLSTLPAPM